ncbi:GNAT family N-acetyltransferase [Tepidiforma sp.]|uniref:GNAT family N-acetyltransferase n=1 Tax=Tepidiforma sp. TaxID=2682230 RepID=UPI002ADD854F|nr:GNAT family N-acetyltransferase [Tepidiforma sp.]
MTRTTEIRRATLADAEGIAAILRGMGNENVGLEGPFDAARVTAWLRRLGDDGALFVAYDGSIPVAFGALDFDTADPGTGLLGVWVLPEYRRRGLATDLAEAILEFARQHGYRRIRGRLPEGNEPALSFLSSIGAMVPLRNPNMRFELPL